MPVYAINRYDEGYTESAKTKANVTLKDCTLTQNGTGTATTHQWCECLADVAAGNTIKFDGGTYTFKDKAYSLYVFSSNGGFIINDGTFIDESTEHTMFEFTWNPDRKTSASEKTYGELYSFLGVPFANISGGEFKNVGEEGSASFTEFLGDNDYYAENDGVYYVTHADPGGWINTTDSATWLNVTKPDSGKVGTLNASLTGSGSTLTLGVASGIESFTMDANDISTTNYTVIDASNVTIPVQITSSDDTTKNAVQTILGTTKDDTLIAGTAGATLNGDFGNDSLVGGTGKDYFIYNAGADSINGYTASQGDLVVLEDFKAGDATFTVDEADSKYNINLNFGGGDLLVFEDVGDNAISVQSGNDNYVYTKNYVALNEGVTLAANYSSVPDGDDNVNTFGASARSFETIDASPVTTEGGVYVIGNTLDNKIFGGTAGGTLYGNAGNDLLDVNDRNADSEFTFRYTAGKDSVNGFDENND